MSLFIENWRLSRKIRSAEKYATKTEHLVVEGKRIADLKILTNDGAREFVRASLLPLYMGVLQTSMSFTQLLEGPPPPSIWESTVHRFQEVNDRLIACRTDLEEYMKNFGVVAINIDLAEFKQWVKEHHLTPTEGESA